MAFSSSFFFLRVVWCRMHGILVGVDDIGFLRAKIKRIVVERLGKISEDENAD